MINQVISDFLNGLPCLIITYLIFKYQFHTTKDYLLVFKENDIERINIEKELLKYNNLYLTDNELKIKEMLNKKRNCLIDHYFNTLDILCYEYLHYKLDRAEFRQMYKNFIINTVKECSEEFSSINCSYKNIIKVYIKLNR